MPAMPASAPCHPQPPAEAGCDCCSAGDATAAAPARRSRSWHARQRLAARGLCLNCGRVAEAHARGVCVHCAKRPPDPGSTACTGCREARLATHRRRYHTVTRERQSAGLCPRCGKREPEPFMRECGPCRDRQRGYAYRGMPDLPTQYTVIGIADGTDHGTWETPMEVAAALAYAKLSLDDVEIVTDAGPMRAFAGR